MTEIEDSPLFSIIVPVYNVGIYLETTFQSLTSQTFKDFEVLAIDDGSTDDGGLYLDELTLKDSRIRVFHQENSGVSAARNKGLDEACGKWIVFVDGDDALRYNALEILADTIVNNPNADLISYGRIVQNNITYNDIEQNCPNTGRSEFVADCTSSIPFDILNHYVVWSETFRRDILGELRFQPLKNGEDVLFCNSIAMQANGYLYLDADLYIYRLLRKGGAYSNKWSKRLYDDYFAMQQGIFHNIVSTPKTIDKVWIKRWIGGLLSYRKEMFLFDRKTRNVYFGEYRRFLKKVSKSHVISGYQRKWIKTATIFASFRYFYITAMFPLMAFSKLRKLI